MKIASENLPHLSENRKYSKTISAYFFRPSLAQGIALAIVTSPGVIVASIIYSILLYFEASFAVQLLVGLFVLLPLSFPFFLSVLWILGPIVYRRIHAISDRDFDQLLDYNQAQLIERGRRKLELHTEPERLDLHDQRVLGQPLVLRTGLPRRSEDWDVEFEETIPNFACGKDNEYRFRIYNITVVYPAQHHLGYYSCDINLETGLILREQSIDCHYKDIVALTCNERCQRVISMPKWWELLEQLLSIFKIFNLFFAVMKLLIYRRVKPTDFVERQVVIELNSGKTLELPYYIRQDQSQQLPGSNLTEETIRAIRRLLREKRMSLVRAVAA